MNGLRWQIRPFQAIADREWLAGLWRSAMPPRWPPLPAALGLLDAGLVAETGPAPVGFVAVDPADSVPLVLVDPGYPRPVSASAISAGPPASRSTAALATNPGGVTPCSPAPHDRRPFQVEVISRCR
jgi:hypothetical protein